MLKKAGIIVAAAATGVLALSSVAFADTVSGNVGNDCAFGNANGETGQVLDGGDGGLLGGIASLITGTVANVTTQANTGNCTNLNVTDVIDSDSGNTTRTIDETEIEDSFNQQFRR